MKPNWPTAVVIIGVIALGGFSIYVQEPVPAAVIGLVGTVVAGWMRQVLP